MKCIYEEGFEPVRAHEWDAGLDLKLKIEGEKLVVYPGCEVKVGTGFKVQIPRGFVGFVISRSGLEAQVHNAVGVIDSGYQGEVFVRLRNPKEYPIQIQNKQRIVQFVLLPLATYSLERVTEFEEVTSRGANGFHSSGIL